MKNVKKFDKFVNENYSQMFEDLEFSTKEDLVDHILSKDEYTGDYSREDLEEMNMFQLNKIHKDITEKELEDEMTGERYGESSVGVDESKNWIQKAIRKKGALRKSLHKKEGEKISASEIDSELQALRAKDKDKDKPGLQLSKRDRTKQRRLNLVKTLRGMRD